MSLKMTIVIASASALALGCGGDARDPDAGGRGDAGPVMDDDAGPVRGDDAGPMTGDDAGLDGGGGGGRCPNATLPSTPSVTYMGSTIGRPNLFESSRLEWGEAGDEALLYVVPETGTYRFTIDEGLTSNQGCAISVHDGEGDRGLHNVGEDCPAEGSVRELPDAYFIAGEGFSDPIELTAGTELLVLVSCATWSMPSTEVDYTLGITRE